MNNDPRTQPLLDWNRLSRENTENAIVSSMFEATAHSTETIESFSTWLLVGAAAVASFFISNADNLLPLVGKCGFLACGAFLSISCIFGLISKMYALRCKIGIEVGAAIRKTFLEHLARHEKEEEKINKSAEFWGITLETGIRMERVMQEFYAPQAKFVVWLTKRTMKKYEGNPQIGYILLVKSLQMQSIYSFLQAISFLCFLLAGFIYAAAI